MTGTFEKYLSQLVIDPHLIYEIALFYTKQLEKDFPKGFGAHGVRAQAITNALKNGKDLNEVREWAGHASRRNDGSLR